MPAMSEQLNQAIANTPPGTKVAGEIVDMSFEPFYDAARILMRSDEPERALKVLDSVPAIYRDHPPKELVLLREQIMFALVTPHAYMSIDMDASVSFEHSAEAVDNLARGREARDLVKKLNEAGQVPHLIESGPGEYWLPMGMMKQGLQFTYKDLSLLQRTGEQARKHLPAEIFRDFPIDSQPVVYVGFEIIEHLFDPIELAIESFRHAKRSVDYVLLSTPMYTFDGSHKDWNRREGMAHLRAYTPHEFLNEANRIFKGYNWEIVMDQVMVAKGTKRGI